MQMFGGCTWHNAMLSCLGGLQDATGVGGCSEAQLVTFLVVDPVDPVGIKHGWMVV